METLSIHHPRTTFAGAAVIALVIGIGALIFFRSRIQTGSSDSLLLQKSLPLPAKGFDLPPINNTAFAAGEKLEYDVIFKGITVGRATIEITNGPLVNGRPTLKYISKAKSNGFFDLFFKVRDENVSTVDKASLFSLSFDQNLREGKYRAVRRYDFDYINKKFTATEKKKDKVKKNEGALEAPLFDVLSALYFARTMPLSPGRDLAVSIFRDEGGKNLPIKVGAEVTSQKTPFGSFPCFKVEPVIQGDSIFKSKDGHLVVWMTNDAHKLPVLMEANASVGTVKVKLTKWEK